MNDSKKSSAYPSYNDVITPRANQSCGNLFGPTACAQTPKLGRRTPASW